MISLMAYAVLIAGLLGLGALVSERVAADLGRARRGIWLLALAGSVAAPAVSLLGPGTSVTPGDNLLPFSISLLPVAVSTGVAAADGAAAESWSSWARSGAVNEALTTFWIVSSTVTLLVCVLAGAGLRRALRTAQTTTIGDHRVVLSDRLGPAVIGFFRPRIVLPEWVADERSRLRSVVLAHERQHIAAHDQLTLLAALLLIAVMPWNVALWWQLRRLRAAIEVDCDARVVGSGIDKVAYSEALLSVRQRSSHVPLGAVALTEPESLLERRIRIMLANARSFSLSRVGLGTTLALFLVSVAFMVEAPQAQQGGGNPASVEGPAVMPAVRTAVYDQLSGAQTCLDAGDMACARAWLDSVAQMDLTDYEAAQYWNLMAFVAYQDDDVAGATNAYENVLAQANIPPGQREAALRSLSTLYAGSGRHAEAYETLNELLELRGIAQVGGLGGPMVADGEYLPIVKVAPVYPPRAAARGIEGYVVVEYTVNAAGATENVRAAESSSTLFEAAAIESARKFKYKPRIIDGHPVAVPGVRSRINFELEGTPQEPVSEQ